ncbi:hypothetical protein TNCV_1845341 [Trichonephila clavipes]|nr:hypothetical protein TNCV_1845341 [Trichonephila clavipes]
MAQRRHYTSVLRNIQVNRNGKKKDGSSRMCIDYRKLNQKLVKINFHYLSSKMFLDTLPRKQRDSTKKAYEKLKKNPVRRPNLAPLTSMEEKQNCIQTHVNKGAAILLQSRRWKVTSRLLHVEKDKYSRRKEYDSYELEVLAIINALKKF